MDVEAEDVQIGDVLRGGARVEGRRLSPDGAQVRLAVRRRSWRCRKLMVLPAGSPVRVLRP